MVKRRWLVLSLRSFKSFTLLIVVTVITGCMKASHSPGRENLGNGFGKLVPTFESLNRKIIETRCVECHSGSKTPHGIDLSTYEKIMYGNVFPPLVVPGEPMRSSLYTSVVDNSMPKNRKPLSTIEKKALFDWIKKGALKFPNSDEDSSEGDDKDDENDQLCEVEEPCEDKRNLEDGEPK